MVRNSYHPEDDAILNVLFYLYDVPTHVVELGYLFRRSGVEISNRQVTASFRRMERKSLIEIYCESAVITPKGVDYLNRN